MKDPIITGCGGVVYDDASIAAEQRHAEAQRAEIITQYGSEDAYEQWCIASTRRIRRERHRAICQMRVERARMTRVAMMASIQAPRRTASSGRPRARRTSASSTTSGADPNGSEADQLGEPLRLAPPARAVLVFAALTAVERGADVEAVVA